jgi:hypothetical protein
MAKIIDFFKAKQAKAPKNQVNKTSAEDEFWNSVLPPLFEWNDFLLETLYQWPCFKKEESPPVLDDLLSQYCNHNLNLSQECVIDLMLHIHDPRYIFDLTVSLKTWDKENRVFFLYFIKKYSKIIEEEHI